MSRAKWERTWAAREDQRRRKIDAMLGEILRTVAMEHKAWLPVIVDAALRGWRDTP